MVRTIFSKIINFLYIHNIMIWNVFLYIICKYVTNISMIWINFIYFPLLVGISIVRTVFSIIINFLNFHNILMGNVLLYIIYKYVTNILMIWLNFNNLVFLLSGPYFIKSLISYIFIVLWRLMSYFTLCISMWLVFQWFIKFYIFSIFWDLVWSGPYFLKSSIFNIFIIFWLVMSYFTLSNSMWLLFQYFE